MENILYIALTLDNISKETLENLATDVVADTDINPKYFCHHSTLAFFTDMTEEIEEFAKEHLGETFPMVADMVGISDKAVAVRVQHDCPCANKIKHITLLTNLDANGKPKDSNDIKVWQPIEPIELKGTLTIYYKK